MPKIDSYKIDSNRIDGPSGSNIKSFQTFAVTLGVGTTSTTQTITSVGNKAVIKNVRLSPSNGNITGQELYVKLNFANSTTVNLVRQTATTYSVTVYFDVIEYNNVKSLQTIDFTYSSTSSIQTITAVNLLKSEIAFSYNVGSSTAGGMLISAYFNSSTQVIFQNYSSGVTTNVTAYIIEFN